MRFLLDVHIGTSIAQALEGQDHDVLRASDAHADWSDARLLDLALCEDRVLITEDRDFSDLIFRYGARAPRSILYLRCEPYEQRAIAERILLVLANVDVRHQMVVIRPHGFRLRPFPNPESDDA